MLLQQSIELCVAASDMNLLLSVCVCLFVVTVIGGDLAIYEGLNRRW